MAAKAKAAAQQFVDDLEQLRELGANLANALRGIQGALQADSSLLRMLQPNAWHDDACRAMAFSPEYAAALEPLLLELKRPGFDVVKAGIFSRPTAHEVLWAYANEVSPILKGPSLDDPADIWEGRERPLQTFTRAGHWPDAAGWFELLAKMEVELREAVRRRVEGLSTDGPSNRKDRRTPKRRGRKKADYATVEREAQLKAEWVRAKDTGIYKPDFAKEKKMTTKQFDTLLDRVYQRERSSE